MQTGSSRIGSAGDAVDELMVNFRNTIDSLAEFKK